MPSRGLAFTPPSRAAPAAAARVLLLVGPDALASDYLRSEWNHARPFAKPAIPALRLGTHEALPDQLQRLYGPDLRESRAYDDGLSELVRVLSEPLPAMGPLRTEVPGLPPHFIDVRAQPGLRRMSWHCRIATASCRLCRCFT
jgi:hypothetical protein